MLDSLSEVGVTVNEEKNAFGLTMFQFLGHKRSSDGVSPTELRENRRYKRRKISARR